MRQCFFVRPVLAAWVPVGSAHFLILLGPLFTTPYRKSVLQFQCPWSDFSQWTSNLLFTHGQMGVTETLRILLTIFLSTACIQNMRLFGVYDVRWPFLAEIHTAPLKRFVPSSVLHAGGQSIVQCTNSVSRVLGRCVACGCNQPRVSKRLH